jgi:hypothetical protein
MVQESGLRPDPTLLDGGDDNLEGVALLWQCL